MKNFLGPGGEIKAFDTIAGPTEQEAAPRDGPEGVEGTQHLLTKFDVKIDVPANKQEDENQENLSDREKTPGKDPNDDGTVKEISDILAEEAAAHRPSGASALYGENLAQGGEKELKAPAVIESKKQEETDQKEEKRKDTDENFHVEGEQGTNDDGKTWVQVSLENSCEKEEVLPENNVSKEKKIEAKVDNFFDQLLTTEKNPSINQQFGTELLKDGKKQSEQSRTGFARAAEALAVDDKEKHQGVSWEHFQGADRGNGRVLAIKYNDCEEHALTGKNNPYDVRGWKCLYCCNPAIAAQLFVAGDDKAYLRMCEDDLYDMQAQGLNGNDLWRYMIFEKPREYCRLTNCTFINRWHHPHKHKVHFCWDCEVNKANDEPRWPEKHKEYLENPLEPILTDGLPDRRYDSDDVGPPLHKIREVKFEPKIGQKRPTAKKVDIVDLEIVETPSRTKRRKQSSRSPVVVKQPQQMDRELSMEDVSFEKLFMRTHPLELLQRDEIKQFWRRQKATRGGVTGLQSQLPNAAEVWHKNEVEWIRTQLQNQEIVAKEKSVVELAAGIGRLGYALFPNARALHFVEPQEHFVKVIRNSTQQATGAVFTTQSELQDWQPLQKYDIVFGCHVFAYLGPEEGAVLAEKISKIVQNQGYLIIIENITKPSKVQKSVQQYVWAPKAIITMIEEGFKRSGISLTRLKVIERKNKVALNQGLFIFQNQNQAPIQIE